MIQGMKVYMATGSLFNRTENQTQQEQEQEGMSMNPQQSDAINKKLDTEPAQPNDERLGTPHTFRSADHFGEEQDVTASDEFDDS